MAQQRVALGQTQNLVAKDRALQVVLEMGKPVRRAHDRRTFADDGIGKPRTVGRRAMLDFLMRRSVPGAAGALFSHPTHKGGNRVAGLRCRAQHLPSHELAVGLSGREEASWSR